MPTSSESRREPGHGTHADRLALPGGDALSALFAAGTIGVSVLVMTLPFLGKQWLLGDLAYHRGVTLSVDLGHPFGEGPIAGVMSYYGGLYHLLLAGISGLSGVTFEQAVAVLSLVWSVVWPASLLLLGRKLWPGNWPAAAVFAAVGTLVMPLTTAFATDLWVESVLPSGMALWPAYPRDLALSFGIVAVALFLDSRRVRRRIGSGVCLALAITSHLQIAGTLALVIIAFAVYRRVRGEGWSPLVDAAMATLVATVLSAWWWAPRVGPMLAGPALLADAPDRLPFRMTPTDFAVQLSWLGLVMIASLGALIVRRRTPGGHPILAVWIAVLVPLLVYDRLADGSAFAPERRTWLQLSIPFSAIAAFEIVALVRRLGRPAVGAVVASGLIVALSVPGMLATLDGLGKVWEDRRIAGRPWPAAEWDGTLAALRLMSRDGPDEVLTYDTEAPWIWSLTGARVFSLWLPGPIKLGFDPKAYTGLAYLERVRLAGRAFDDGLAGVCRLATDRHIRTLVLRSMDGVVATRDHAFAAPYRTDPADRSATPPTRRVAAGITYVDTGPDWLLIDDRARVSIPFDSAGIRTVVIEVRTATPGTRVRLTLRSGDSVRNRTTDGGSGVQALRFDLSGADAADHLTIRANGEVLLLRASAYEPVTFAHPVDGAFLVTSDQACGSATGDDPDATRW